MDSYPEIDDPNFQYKIAQRLEFRNLYNIDGLYPHQEFVRRFMSPYTPYKQLILYHSLGSGKSIACISIAVDHYLYDKKKCIIVTKGDSGSNNFLKQIDMYSNMSSRKNDWNKSIFTIKHYISLSNLINNLSPEDVTETFSNKIIILDEIHNVRYIKQKEDISSTVYGSIIRLLQLCNNVKMVMATATPMTDNDEQINSLLGICNYSRHDKLSMNGIISYNSSIRNKPMSQKIGTENYVEGMRIYTSIMTGYQREVYMNENKDVPPDDIYRELTHISLFCFDDTTHGRKVLLDKMIKSKQITTMISMSTRETKELKYIKYELKPEYYYLLQQDELAKCSCKYSTVMKDLENTQGNVFIFIEEVRGSGLLLFASILEYYGYELYLGEDLTTIQKKKRYTMCIGSVDICPNISDRLDGFNSSLNKNGEYVRILLGSKVIGESITLRNVKNFHCLTPHWNDSTVDQAIGRVVRNGSHLDLPEKERNVNIYIHAAVFPDDPLKSVDIKKLQKSKDKENSIKRVSDKMINSAVDKYCILESEVPITLFTNFAAAYLHHHIDIIKNKVFAIMIKNFGQLMSIQYLSKELDIEEVVLCEALCRIIYNNEDHNNEYFLRAWEYSVFLVSDPSLPYITMVPNNYLTYPKVIPEITDDIEPYIDTQNFIESFRYQSAKQKAVLIEKAISENSEQILQYIETLYVNIENTKYYHFLLYKDVNNSYTSTSPVPRKTQKYTRVFEDNKWEYIDSQEHEQEIFEVYKNLVNSYLEELDQRHPIYGIISTIDGEMRIRLRDTEDRAKSSVDKRFVKRGKNMKSIKKDLLLNILRDINKYEEKHRYMSIGEIVSVIDSALVEQSLTIFI